MTLRAMAFGEVEIGIWGSAFDLGEGGPGFTAVGTGGEAAVLDRPSRIELSDDEAGTWWLASEDLELEGLPEGEPATLPDGFDQLARIRGRLRAGGADYEVDPVRDLRPVCPNCHAVLHRREPPYSLDEVREFLQARRR